MARGTVDSQLHRLRLLVGGSVTSIVVSIILFIVDLPGRIESGGKLLELIASVWPYFWFFACSASAVAGIIFLLRYRTLARKATIEPKPKALSALQKKVILHLGGISNGTDSFRNTMERMGLDYFQKMDVGKFNAELARLKTENILTYGGYGLCLTTQGWEYLDKLIKDIPDEC